MIASISTGTAPTILTPTATPRPSVLPSAPADPLDTADVTSAAPTPPRPIYEEAGRLGLLAAGGTVGGPLGQVLSATAQQDLLQLLQDIESKGFEFAHIANANEPRSFGATPYDSARVASTILESNGNFTDASLTLSTASPRPSGGSPRLAGGDGLPMRYARIESLADLQAADALCVRRDPKDLPNEAQARTLLDLEQADMQFAIDCDTYGQVEAHLAQGRARTVGAYGAWRALNVPDERKDAERLYVGPKKGSPSPLHNANDVETAAFFQLGRHSARLEAEPLAVGIRDMAQAGFTFHYSTDDSEDRQTRTPRNAYEGLLPENFKQDVYVGVRGYAREEVTAEQLVDPSKLSQALRDLSQWDQEHVAPRLADGRFTPREANTYVQALAEPIGQMSVAERGAVLEELLAWETDRGTRPEWRVGLSARSLRTLAKVLRDGEDIHVPMRELQALRATLEPTVAMDALVYFRQELPALSFDGPDLAEQRERLTRVAALGDSFESAVTASELLAYTLPLEEGLALLGDLARADRGLKDPTGKYDSWLNDRRRTYLDQAVEDYKLILRERAPGETPREAAQALMPVHAVLVPAVGWDKSRESFVFLQKATARKAFPRTKDEGVQTFLQTFMLKKDLEAARRASLEAPLAASDSRIKTEDNDIIVGGIRIPRRRA